jgi:hypothetical protein
MGRGEREEAGVRTLLRATALLAAAAATAGAQDAAASAPAPKAEADAPPTGAPATASATASRRRSRQPIHDSAERQVEAIVRKYLDPCLAAHGKGVPCFPVTIESEGPRFSVREDLRTYHPEDGPTPGVPTRAEIQRQMSGAPLSASGGVSTDPACAAKSLMRLFKGRPNRFFLYRTWNEKGEEEALLTDHKLDPGSYATPAVRYEFVGEFKGECEAIAAWRRALRESMAPPAVDEAPRATPP